MKILRLPVKVYETGDRVLTPEGSVTVIHDELEGIESRLFPIPQDDVYQSQQEEVEE